MTKDEYDYILGEGGADLLNDLLNGRGGNHAGSAEARDGILRRLREVGEGFIEDKYDFRKIADILKRMGIQDNETLAERIARESIGQPSQHIRFSNTTEEDK